MTVEEYLANVSPSQRAHYERIKTVVKSVVPDAEETISYAIPTFKYKGKYVLYFGAFKNHMSVFPGAAGAERFAPEGFTVRKGTIQFTDKKPLPDEVIKDIVMWRMNILLGE